MSKVQYDRIETKQLLYKVGCNGVERIEREAPGLTYVVVYANGTEERFHSTELVQFPVLTPEERRRYGLD
jgi:hypothetical protein